MWFLRFLSAAWTWIVGITASVWLFYVRHTDPRHVVAVFLVANAIIAVIAGLMTKTWADFYTVSGYWITLTGFLVAIGELYRARTLNSQIRDALAKESRRQRGLHYRYCLEQAQATLSDAVAHVQGNRWQIAVLRLTDLLNHLSRVNTISPAADDRWGRFATETRSWIVIFSAGRTNQRLTYNGGSWQQMVDEIRNSLNTELAPFSFGEEVEDDSE